MHHSRRFPTGQKSEIGAACVVLSERHVLVMCCIMMSDMLSCNAVIACTFHLGPKVRNLVMS